MESIKINVDSELLALIMEDARHDFEAYSRDDFEEGEEVHRWNDWGDYVSEDDWAGVWDLIGHVFYAPDTPGFSKLHPGKFYEEFYVLQQEGYDVDHMTLQQVHDAYSNPSFEPEVCYYTTWPE